MLISRIGEFGLIERFRQRIRTNSLVVKGSGDDCAVLKFNKDNYQLFTCDMLVEGVDFCKQENPYLIGRKAIAVSISDIAACAGLPQHCLVSLGLPKKTSLKFVDRLFKGMSEVAVKYRINIVGGDLSQAPQLTIDVSMLGLVEQKYLVLRSGARENDIIFVTGSLGGSISGKHLKFTPRLKEARFLVENFQINSMIDISDGLIQDLKHILKLSKLGAVIFAQRIPVSRAAQGLNDALTSGEDFELLFTASPAQAERIFRDKRARNFRAIGEIVKEKYGLKLIDRNGKEKNITPKGYRHF
ncbi:MAG: thiamine-phosphate kinase [Candidatus Omnitrophica bacterium]|nr:thiamine-phosphate kinase [Candidatus Omnitrophota bacterium]